MRNASVQRIFTGSRKTPLRKIADRSVIAQSKARLPGGGACRPEVHAWLIRRRAGPTAPARGLVLVRVLYPAGDPR